MAGVGGVPRGEVDKVDKRSKDIQQTRCLIETCDIQKAGQLSVLIEVKKRENYKKDQ
jgi:hypothetical protein